MNDDPKDPPSRAGWSTTRYSPSRPDGGPGPYVPRSIAVSWFFKCAAIFYPSFRTE